MTPIPPALETAAASSGPAATFIPLRSASVLKNSEGSRDVREHDRVFDTDYSNRSIRPPSTSRDMTLTELSDRSRNDRHLAQY